MAMKTRTHFTFRVGGRTLKQIVDIDPVGDKPAPLNHGTIAVDGWHAATCSSLSQNRFLATIPNPLPKTNQDRIVRAEKLMSSDPSSRLSAPGSRAKRRCVVFAC